MISYICGKFDILRQKELENLDKMIQESKEAGSEAFGVGIYSDSVCESTGAGIPIKSLKDRMEIMKNIIGVDFTFPVTTTEEKEIETIIKKYYEKHLQEKKEKEKQPKEKMKYTTAYAPGTYDLFHAGHLENLTIAAQNSEKLIVGIKSDSLVQKHKNKTTVISQEERKEIIRHLRFVDDAYIYYTRDLNVAKDWIEAKYGKLDAVFLGSDLKDDFKHYKNINIVFTERPPELMKERSTTSYAKKLKNHPKKTEPNTTYKGGKLKTLKDEITKKHESTRLHKSTVFKCQTKKKRTTKYKTEYRIENKKFKRITPKLKGSKPDFPDWER